MTQNTPEVVGWNLPAGIDLTKANLPEAYSQAREKIRALTSLEDAKQFVDKMEAAKAYAAMFQDDSLEKACRRLKAHAYRRVGELLNEHDGRRQEEGRPTKRSVADEAGLTPKQTRFATRLAKLPAEEFDRKVSEDDPPSVSRLAGASSPPAAQTWEKIVAFASSSAASDLSAVVKDIPLNDLARVENAANLIIAQMRLFSVDLAKRRRSEGIVDDWEDLVG